METSFPPISQLNALGPKPRFSIFGARLSAIDGVLLGAITIILALQLYLQFVQKINWDEFFYLSHIYDAQNGRLDKLLQMGHVYLLGWLTHIPGGEIAQITAGRVAMWVAQLGTLVLILRTARKFMSFTNALFSVLCFLGLGFVFIHGTSFRADPLAAFCMMFAVYVLAASELKFRDLAGLSVALALGAFVTIKVILFAPLLAVLALWRLGGSDSAKHLFLKFSLTVFGAVSLLGVSLLLHGQTLLASANIDSASSLAGTFETVFFSGGLFPRIGIMKVGFITGFVPSILVILGFIAALWPFGKKPQTHKAHLIMASMALPLLSFVFYRNAYPYFYASICPSAALLAGYAAQRLKFSKIIITVFTVMIGLNTALLYSGRIGETRAVQTQTLDAVHQIFPQPVNYFDRNGMIASFPKAGFFMSSWGLRNYDLGGEPIFTQELSRKSVPLLIENSPALSAALRGEPSGLLDADSHHLKNNYIPHWGHIWVAGKALTLSPEPRQIDIVIPGTYTLESNGDIQIGAQLYRNGDYVTLSRGAFIMSSSAEQDVVLRWGKDLERPDDTASKAAIFGSF